MIYGASLKFQFSKEFYLFSA